MALEFTVNATGLIETINATTTSGEVENLEFDQGTESSTLAISYLAPTTAQEVTLTIIVTDQLGQETTFEFVVTVNAVTSAKEVVQQNINFYPNPTNGIVNIELPVFTKEIPAIILTDINGKQIDISPVVGNDIIQLDLSGLSKGVYLLIIDSTDSRPIRIIKN